MSAQVTDLVAVTERRSDLRRRIAEIHRQRRELNDQEDALQAELAATWTPEASPGAGPDLVSSGASR